MIVITPDFVEIGLSAQNWEEALRKSSRILLDKQMVEPRYVDAMVNSMHKNGAYFVITSHIALAHARPEDGVLQKGLSFSLLSPPVSFNAGDLDPIKLIITLAADSNDGHIEVISELADVLSDSARLEQLFQAKTAEEFCQLLSS
ncbi:MAG: PTS sugar transporter subunit IIA [Brevinema sp.]